MLPHLSLPFLLLSSALSFVPAVKTLSHRVRHPTPAADDAAAVPTVTAYYFDQLIDHENPSLGTFKQRYFFSDEYWTRQGAPIVLANPGEQSADGFDDDLTSPGSLQTALMMSLGAAGVVLEHRYWGESSPYQNLTTANLEYLTLDQSIEDTRYFVQHAKLPWTKKAKTSNPEVVPWINIGCSYPGVLSAYTQKRYPKLFAAAWASSAPVQAVGDFWQYFEPIEEGMSKNCSKDVGEAITHIDQILLYGSEAEKRKLKKSFGLEKLRDDDFAQALVHPIWGWQNMDPGSYATDGEDPFFQFCDAIETHPNGKISKSAKGVGMPTALNNHAKWIKAKEAAGCDGGGGACYSTYDYTTDKYTDWRVDNHDGDRQWNWMICNEFGFFQGGDPGNYSVIVSSLVTESYNIRQCNHMFLNADGSLGNFYPDTANVKAENGGGWNLRARNLFVVNGQYDPWRSASLSSIYAPKFRNTPHQRVEVIRGGHHCWDFNLDGAKYNHDIKRVVDIGVNRIKKWVKQWYKAHRHVENSMPKVLYYGNDYGTDQYTNWRVDNPGESRQWSWMVCNEFGWFLGGDPGNYSVIVSSLITESYTIRQCNHEFPNADGSLGNFYPDTAGTNAEHGGGWNLRPKNLFVVNGQYDPWRSASLSSVYAPKFRNTPHQRIEVIRGGHHCWDFGLEGAKYNHDIKRVVDIGVKRVKKWVTQWYKGHRQVENSMPKGKVDYWAGIL